METLVRWPLTSIRLDICRPDHLAPLFGFVVDQLSEIGRRARKYHAAQVGQLSPKLGIGEARVDLPVELVDDLGGCFPGRTKPEITARFITRNKFAHRRKIRQGLRTRDRRYRQRTQLARPD